MIVIDSYAWIEYFRGSEQGETVKRHMLEDAVTPSIVLPEIARKYVREGISEQNVRSRLDFVTMRSEVHEISIDVALLAAAAHSDLAEKARRDGLDKPSLADGVILATTRKLRAHVLTGDRHFQGLPETIFLE